MTTTQSFAPVAPAIRKRGPSGIRAKRFVEACVLLANADESFHVTEPAR